MSVALNELELPSLEQKNEKKNFQKSKFPF